MLMEDDLEDAFNITNILQNIIKRLLNHLPTGLNTAPNVRTIAFDGGVQLKCELQGIVAVFAIGAGFLSNLYFR